MSKTVTVTRRTVSTVRDAQGNFTEFDTSFPLLIIGFAPRASDESADANGARTITGGTIYGYLGTDLRPTDRLTIDGVSGWQIEGDTGSWKSIFGTGLGGVEVGVKRNG